jgi:hypothetical protein
MSNSISAAYSADLLIHFLFESAIPLVTVAVIQILPTVSRSCAGGQLRTLRVPFPCLEHKTVLRQDYLHPSTALRYLLLANCSLLQ